MADKLRRTKDILKDTLTSYLEATTESEYLAYFEGSPTYITYFQIDSEASLTDIGLETVNSLIGANSPNKYKQVNSLPVYGIDALSVSNEISERGVTAVVNGEFLMLPNAIRPYPGDFFMFEYSGLESHIFRVNDVQYDKIMKGKYFRCEYALWPENTSVIQENISSEWECYYDEDSGTITLVEASEAAANEEIEDLTDALIDKYTSLFYDEASDSFVWRGVDYDNGEEIFYWSPYLQHFLYETKALEKSEYELMTEIYFSDINSVDFPNIYNEKTYRDSIYRNVQIQNPDLNFSANFVSISDIDLKMFRNLPFFMCPVKFKLITPIVQLGKDDPSAYMNAVPLFFTDDELQYFKYVDHYHKVHVMDEVHLSRLTGYIKDGEIVYECNRHELEPTKIYQASVDDSDNLSVTNVSIVDRVPTLENETTQTILEIIINYLKGDFTPSDDILNTLNNLYYEDSLQNYLLIPVVIYILQKSISTSS